MRKLILLTAIVIATAVVPSTANASTLINAPATSPFPYAQWIEEAQVPTPERTLTVIEDNTECGGQGAGCTGPNGIIYMAPEWMSKREFFHELGHQFDYLMPSWVRWRFEQLRGDTRPWRSEGGNSPHEQFAEAYSLCATYGDVIPPKAARREEWGYEYHPSKWLQKKVCRMIRHAFDVS